MSNFPPLPLEGTTFPYILAVAPDHADLVPPFAPLFNFSIAQDGVFRDGGDLSPFFSCMLLPTIDVPPPQITTVSKFSDCRVWCAFLFPLSKIHPSLHLGSFSALLASISPLSLSPSMEVIFMLPVPQYTTLFSSSSVVCIAVFTLHPPNPVPQNERFVTSPLSIPPPVQYAAY